MVAQTPNRTKNSYHLLAHGGGAGIPENIFEPPKEVLRLMTDLDAMGVSKY